MFSTFKNFFNKILNSARIFTKEDIAKMSTKEFIKHEKAIDYQMMNLGIPTNAELLGRDDVVFVHEYLRGDGTVVSAHYRSKPDSGISLMDDTNKIPANEMSFGESVINSLTKDAGKVFPLANANLQNAVDNFIYAKNDKNAHILNSVSEIKNQQLLNLMKNIKIPENSKGIYYDINSKFSKDLYNSNEIQSYIKNNIGTLFDTDETIVVDIEFLRKNNYDNYLGVQNCKLFNPKIGKDGYFDAMIIDYYDFEYRVPNNIFDFNKHINNWGYSMQEKNIFKIILIYTISMRKYGK